MRILPGGTTYAYYAPENPASPTVDLDWERFRRAVPLIPFSH
jgi:hypothetical protein